MKKYFLTGLVLLLPVVVTLYIIVFIVKLLTNPFVGLVSKFISNNETFSTSFLFLQGDHVVKVISQISILVFLFLFILLLGLLARWFLTRWLIKGGDYILHRLPLVNKVYKTTKEIVSHLFGEDKKTFKQVVLVPFPREGIYTIGFLSAKAPDDICQEVKNEMVSVFIPTTPNPTTGFTVIFKVKDIYYLKMKPEAAIKFIVSCGIVHPEDIGSLKENIEETTS